MPSQLRYKDYTVVWIAILPVEAEVALKVLDRRHDGLFKSVPGDDYLYIGGELNGHNIAIATLPAGQNYGIGSAAALANQIKTRFVNIWFALLVGVAAGLPNLSADDSDNCRDIRLGDVLVAEPNKSSTGVVHYDLGRNTEDGFQINGRLAETPSILRSAFTRMKLLYDRPYKDGSVLAEYLRSLDAIDGHGRYKCPDAALDRLFRTSGPDTQNEEIRRQPRDNDERTLVWYGTIGSGNSLMRNARERDQLRDRYDLIGLEMEAAGIMNTLPTGVIRGVCDYGDRHKTKNWQPYAAAVAAVYAKGVLNFIQPKTISNSTRLRDFQADGHFAQIQKSSDSDDKILGSLAFARMKDRRLNIHKPHTGTCHWILNLPLYIEWDLRPQGLLWIKGKPGSGKSTIMSFLYSVIGEKIVPNDTIFLEFFFSARGDALQHSFSGMLRSLLNQMFQQDPGTRDSLRKIYKEKSSNFGDSAHVWEWQEEELKLLLEQALLRSATNRQLFIFIDALDETGEDTALAIADYFHAINSQLSSKSVQAKIYISCRHYPITTEFPGTEIHVEAHNKTDIRLIVEAYIFRSGSYTSGLWERKEWTQLTAHIVKQANGVFQWVSLILPMILRSVRNGLSPQKTRQLLVQVPKELSDVYEHIIRNVIDREFIDHSLMLFQWICLAERPLSLSEIRCAVAASYASQSLKLNPGIKYSDTDIFATSDLAMRVRLRALSGGLLEDANEKVQVVHQTVKEFLMKHGLSLLESFVTKTLRAPLGLSDPNRSPDALGPLHCAHARIYGACLHLLIAELKDSTIYPRHKDKLTTDLPLLSYAIDYVFWHAKKAGHCHLEQPATQATYINQIARSWTPAYMNLSLPFLVEFKACQEMRVLHIAAAFGLDDLLDHSLQSDASTSIDEREPGTGCTALHFAVVFNQYNEVKHLLMAGAKANVKTWSQERAWTPLTYASRDGQEQTVQLLLEHQNKDNEYNQHDDDAFLQACHRGHRNIAMMLLPHHANVNTRDVRGGTALHGASTRGDELLVRALLAHQADVNIQDEWDETALLWAAENDHEVVVKLLLEHQAAVDIANATGETPLIRAALHGNKEIVRLLLAHQAGVNIQDATGHTALQRAARQGHEEVVRQLLAHKADVSIQDGHGHTPIIGAARCGNEIIVQMLLAHHADVNIQGDYGGTALISATQKRHPHIVQLLLTHKARVNVRDVDGRTALISASTNGEQIIVQHLLAHHAQVNVKDEFGNTALLCAAQWDHIDIARQLLAHQADINIQNKNGNTALLCAMWFGLHRMVLFLLQYEADVNVYNQAGDTTLILATQYGDWKIVSRLLKLGADVDAQNGTGNTAVMYAAQHNNKRIVWKLLARGADLSFQNKDGDTALSWAIRNRHMKLVWLLFGYQTGQRVTKRKVILWTPTKRVLMERSLTIRRT